jgi:hypothetical protein
MALSPNYGWAEPDNSSLVKNGAADIRTLGDAIDTSVWNVGYGQAGKNKIINGDFYWNQRQFTSTTTSSTYGQDRWQLLGAGGTSTYSAETFTPGTAPVAGYEGRSFARIVSTGQSAAADRTVLTQRIEEVRTFAGQTVTVSFWAKASTGTPSVAADFAQGFGGGGSSTVNVAGQKTAITASWARYNLTFSIPSVLGKTIVSGADQLQLRLWTSAGSDWNTHTNTLGIQSVTIDFWGVQVEYGSKATPFQTATGTIQGELAACQRYYQRFTIDTDGHTGFIGNAYLTTASSVTRGALVSMRTTPSSVDFSNVTLYDGVTFFGITGLTIWAATESHTFALLATGATGLTQYRSYFLLSSGAAGFVALNAEL